MSRENSLRTALDERNRMQAIASNMTDEELQLALARLADAAEATAQPPELLMLRGSIAKELLAARQRGELKFSRAGRMFNYLLSAKVSEALLVLYTRLRKEG